MAAVVLSEVLQSLYRVQSSMNALVDQLERAQAAQLAPVVGYDATAALLAVLRIVETVSPHEMGERNGLIAREVERLGDPRVQYHPRATVVESPQ